MNLISPSVWWDYQSDGLARVIIAQEAGVDYDYQLWSQFSPAEQKAIKAAIAKYDPSNPFAILEAGEVSS